MCACARTGVSHIIQPWQLELYFYFIFYMLHDELCTVVPTAYSMTLTLFEGQSEVKQLKLKDSKYISGGSINSAYRGFAVRTADLSQSSLSGVSVDSRERKKKKKKRDL